MVIEATMALAASGLEPNVIGHRLKSSDACAHPNAALAVYCSHQFMSNIKARISTFYLKLEFHSC